MNIGERYVLTIADVFKGAESGKDKARVSGFDNLIFDDNGLGKLENLEDVLQEACDNARREGYGEGLNAAWECARKIIPLWEKGKTADIFGTRDIETIFKGYFASDAMSKIKEYEDEQAEAKIEVGDEVTISSSMNTLIVVTVYKDSVRAMNRFGATVWVDTCCVKKTGRHFDAIEKLYEEMKK